MTSNFTFVFSEEIQREREALQQTIREAVAKGTLESVRSAQEKLRAWLEAHPDDYVLWDAGESLALLADALQEQETEPVRVS